MSLDIVGLTKRFEEFIVFLGLSVRKGETLVLAGPSGCGKTTALHLIAGLIDADGGSLHLGGSRLDGLPAWKRNMALVFQDAALFPHLSVAGNIEYALKAKGIDSAGRRRAVEENLRKVRLEGFGPRRVDTLSGGEKQRVAIARALAMSPDALLLDEPFSSLDGPLRRELREEFKSLRQDSDIPCVFVTHDREEAAHLGDNIALMKDGRIVEYGSALDLFLRPKTDFAAKFFANGHIIDRSDAPPLFIPKNAIRPWNPAGMGVEGQKLVRLQGRVDRVRFDGDSPIYTLVLQGGTRIELSGTDPRRPAPIGSIVEYALDESLAYPLEKLADDRRKSRLE